MTGVSFAAFARRMGCSRSYVSRLAKADRLVLTDDGRVDLDASLTRIHATATHPHRSKLLAQSAGSTAGDGESYRDWRTRRELAEAGSAEIAYRIASGELAPVADVEYALSERGARVRARIDELPTRIAWAASAGMVVEELQREIDVLIAELERPLNLSASPAGDHYHD